MTFDWEYRRVVALLALALAVPASAAELGGFDCLIEPDALIDVSTREEGVVEEILVSRGDLVEKGQELVRLDSHVEAANVDLARARARKKAELEEKRNDVSFAKRQLERIDTLYQKKTVSFHERDKASTDLARVKLQLSQVEQQQRVAKLELQRALKLLDRRTIHSPTTGVVVERMLSPGESVENRPILRVARIDPLNVEVIIPVKYYGEISIGMKAVVMPKFPGASSHTATVTVVDRVVDAASNTFGVRLELPNPDHRVPGGVRCDIRFQGV